MSAAENTTAIVCEGGSDEFVRLVYIVDGKGLAQLNGQSYSLCDGIILIADSGDSLVLDLWGKSHYYTVCFLPEALIGSGQASFEQGRLFSVLYDVIQQRIFSKDDFTNTDVYNQFNNIIRSYPGLCPFHSPMILLN